MSGLASEIVDSVSPRFVALFVELETLSTILATLDVHGFLLEIAIESAIFASLAILIFFVQGCEMEKRTGNEK